MTRNITPFVHKKVVVLRENATAYEAARAMCEQNIGTVIVTNGHGHVTGIMTDRDLVCGLLTPDQNLNTQIKKMMSHKPATVGPHANLNDVVSLMKKHGVRRIPMVEQIRSGVQHCVGLLSLDDLILSRQIPLADIREILKIQLLHKKRVPEWRSADLSSAEISQKFLRDFVSRAKVSTNFALSLVALIAGLVIRRLHFSVASDLIAKLPTQLRSELLDLPAGPDLTITSEKILEEIASRFGIGKDRAEDYVQTMWNSLEQVDPDSDCREIFSALPPDIQQLFRGALVPGEIHAQQQFENQH